MADTQRSIAQIRGEIYITTPAATTPDDTASYKDVAGTFALVAATADNWDMNTNGQLRYTGAADRILHITCAVSMISAANNQLLHFRLAKNGTSMESTEIQRKVGTGADVGAAALTGLIEVTNGDYITLEVRNETSTATVTTTLANIVAVDGAI